MEFDQTTLLNIGSWMLAGAVIGYIISKFDPRDVKNGGINAVLLGTIGGLIGGIIGQYLGNTDMREMTPASYLPAVIGAVALVILQRITSRSEGKFKTTTNKLK